MRKTAGTGPSAGVLGLPLRNDGTVESLSGVLKVEDGGATPDTGTFRGASRANRVLLGAGRTLDGDVALEGTVEIGSFVGPISVVAGETLTGAAGPAPDRRRLLGEPPGHGHDDAGPAAARSDRARPRSRPARRCASTASPRRRAPRCSSPTGTGSATRGSSASSRAPTCYASSPQRPRIDNAATIELDGGAADPCGSQTGILGDPLVTNTGTIEKVAGTSPALVRGALDNDGAVASRAGELELDGDPAALQSGTFASTGAGSTITLRQGRFALGPAAAVTGRTVVKGFAELAIPAGTTLPVPAGDRLELRGDAVRRRQAAGRRRARARAPSASRPAPARPRSPRAGR